VNTFDQSDSIRLHELLLSHLLPKGFRRSRNYGLTHHRRTILLRRVQLMLHVVIPIAKPKTRRPCCAGAAASQCASASSHGHSK